MNHFTLGSATVNAFNGFLLPSPGGRGEAARKRPSEGPSS